MVNVKSDGTVQGAVKSNDMHQNLEGESNHSHKYRFEESRHIPEGMPSKAPAGVTETVACRSGEQKGFETPVVQTVNRVSTKVLNLAIRPQGW